MSEYIEREALLRALSKEVEYGDDGEQEINSDTVFITIEGFPAADAVPVVRGEWVYDENDTEWTSHQCSVCKKSSLREMIYEDDYDEGLDGEWFYLGKREIGIIEHLTDYCPNCGAKMEDKPCE